MTCKLYIVAKRDSGKRGNPNYVQVYSNAAVIGVFIKTMLKMTKMMYLNQRPCSGISLVYNKNWGLYIHEK